MAGPDPTRWWKVFGNGIDRWSFGFAITPAEAVGNAHDMPVGSDCRDAKGIAGNDSGTFSANTRNFLQTLWFNRHFAVVMFDQPTGSMDDAFRFLFGEGICLHIRAKSAGSKAA